MVHTAGTYPRPPLQSTPYHSAEVNCRASSSVVLLLPSVRVLPAAQHLAVSTVPRLTSAIRLDTAGFECTQMGFQ